MEPFSRQAPHDTVLEKTQHTAKDASSTAAAANPGFPGAKLLVAEGSHRKYYLTSCAFLTSLDVYNEGRLCLSIKALQTNPSLFHTGIRLRKSVNLKFDLSYDLFAIFSHYTNTNITGIFLQP